MYRSHSANNQHVMLQLNVQLKYRLSFIVIQRIYSYLLFFFFFTSNSKDIIHNPFFKKNALSFKNIIRHWNVNGNISTQV